jgi:hypothetical protein
MLLKEKYDILIIGAGPAGLMAALQCSRRRHSGMSPSNLNIAILEKMSDPAIKLKLTGKGRCNITNSASLKEFIKHFGKNGRFLRHAFSNFFNEDLIKYFEKLGVEFKLERGGRYFPKSDSAMDVASALVANVESKGLPIFKNYEVINIKKVGKEFIVKNRTGKNIKADKIVLACGGKSYPRTGSSGGGYELAKNLGHKIIDPKPSLTPLITKGLDAKKLQGLSLKNVKASLYSEGEKINEEFGEMLFTDFGLSGPIILSLSKYAVPLLSDKKNVSVSIDLKPALDHEKIDERLKREINENGKKYFKNLLKNLLPAKLIPVFIEKLRISEDKKLNQINSNERKKLKILLKEFKFDISGFKSFDQAIVTSGGVDLKEVNPKTMESKIVKGLYFAGEILDLDADTGGYNLQAAFSTGWVVGEAIKETKYKLN